jgi:hypothetical protein
LGCVAHGWLSYYPEAKKKKKILGGSRKVMLPYNSGWKIKNKCSLCGKCLGDKHDWR